MQTQIGFLKFTHEQATARLTLWDDNIGHVSGVYSRVRGQGHATKVLEAICSFLDNNQMMGQLEVSSYGPSNMPGLTDKELVDFYMKFGFEVVMDMGLPVLMQREPTPPWEQDVLEDALVSQE